MASSTSGTRPGRSFIGLAVITLVLAAVLTGGVIWGKASASPKLALDLEGGTSIVLAPQLSGGQEITKEQLDQAVAIIRQRVDSTGVSESEVTTQGGRNIVVNIPGNPDEQTRQLIRSSAQLRFRPVLVQGAPGPAGATEPAESEKIPEDVQKQIDELNKGKTQEPKQDEKSDAPSGGGNATPDAGGNATPDAGGNATSDSKDEPKPSEPAPEDGGINVPVPEDTPKTKPSNGSDMAWITDSIAAKYYALDCTKEENRTGGSLDAADTALVACSQDGSAKYILGPVEIEGQHIKDASQGYKSTSSGQQTSEPVVNLEFDREGTDQFREITTRLTGQQPPLNQFGIVMDGNVISAPSSEVIISDGKAEISGSFTTESAQTLANQLKNGALPISFKVQTEQQISATLGSDYLAKGLLAGVIGLLLVVVYSLFQYRTLGLVTVASLAVAGVLTYLLLCLVGWRYGYRLSLAGVAGVIVAIGMTADSFIVYFERVRDELRGGRGLVSAVEIGWNRASRTIYASKSVNLLAAIVLYVLAVGSVRGFAFTLGLTVLIDVLVVLLFTHPMLQLLAKTKFFGQGHPWSGLDPRRLGVKKAQYRGAMGFDFDEAKSKAKKKNTGAAAEAERRMTIAERRAAAEAGTADSSATDADKVSASSSKES
ncbi:protein translocase subunit SecD [Saxibacter everestensis]|uniref:Protein translocase subunit SecD n=1 Tax=Saxibacter everestensis TaxID=2909229 RepID=A0ABY8QZQ0_9MICO|nr:protein translocase subunit SecD [Brevibacteriaceae bacterium ZFBP1038]